MIRRLLHALAGMIGGRRLLRALAGAVLALLCVVPSFATYNFTRTITQHHIYSPSPTTFPMLFSDVYPFLKDVAHGGSVQSSSGYDIAFSSDAAGTTLLPCEKQEYDPVTGRVVFWVLVPVDNVNDSTYYLQYGLAGTISSPCLGTNVWTSAYKGVYHLTQTSGPYLDSTSNHADSTGGSYPTQAAGDFGLAQSFTGSQYIRFTNPIIGNSTGVTYVFWIKTTTAPQGIADNGGGTTKNTSISIDSTGHAVITDVGNGISLASTATVNDGNWHFVVGQVWGTGAFDIFVDATHQGATYLGAPVNQAATMYLGALRNPSNFSTAVIEEFRVSSTLFTVGEVLAMYNSEGSPSTFYTLSGGGGGGGFAGRTRVILD